MNSVCPELSVVVPLHNESANVLPLVEGIVAAVGHRPGGVELILVDDCSTDETWERMAGLARADSRIRVLRHLRRGGQSAALWTGFTASCGKLIATLDGDLQNDPADLPRLISELSNVDLVCGVRVQRKDNALRRISTYVARQARRLVLGVDFRDTGCGLRAFKRGVLDFVPRFNGFHRFMPVLVEGTGVSIKEVPVSHHPRVAGRSKYGIWNRLGRGIYDLVGVRWYRKRRLMRLSATQLPSIEGGKRNSCALESAAAPVDSKA